MLSSTTLQISDDSRTKLSLNRPCRFVIAAVNHETAKHDICIGVSASPSQMMKIFSEDPSPSLIVVFPLYVGALLVPVVL